VETTDRVLRFGAFEFRPTTGDLRRLDAAVTTAPVRLPPQPAKLLELLIERRGALLEREQIRRALWPDTHVDFDQSLAFCVRQLRAALGDSGTEPTYIETLPRRGFRLVAAVHEAAATVARPALESDPRRAGRGYRRAALAIVVAASVAAWLLLRPSPPARLAIMPFELAALQGTDQERARLARISEWLVTELAAADTGIDVIGPRTTATYHGSPFPDLDALARDLDLDFVLNCRYLASVPGEPTTLLVELIRLDTRAHPWVNRFDGEQPWLEIATAVRDGVRNAIVRSR
jgi:DNA-binding winged helix-turn-helix (wHTH) protein/TolB-like protein